MTMARLKETHLLLCFLLGKKAGHTEAANKKRLQQKASFYDKLISKVQNPKWERHKLSTKRQQGVSKKTKRVLQKQKTDRKSH